MKLIHLASPLLVLALVSGCTSLTSSGGEDGANQSAPIEWTEAQGIEFVTDHTTDLPNARKVLAELERQTKFPKSPVTWRPDPYPVSEALELYVDAVYLSSGEGSAGCALWVFGFEGWTTQAIDGNHFDWVQEEIEWGAFSDGILGYVLIYTNTNLDCYGQAMRTINGEYAPNRKVAKGIQPDPSFVVEYVEDQDSLRIGNAGDKPIKLNDEFCIVTAEKAYIDKSWGRMTGTLKPGEAFYMGSYFASESYLDADIPKQLGVGNCTRGEYRALIEWW